MSSFVSNYIGGISSLQMGGISGVSGGLDLSDTTFSDLLEKQMKIGETQNSIEIFNQLGMPAGMEIEPLESISEIQAVENKADDYNIKTSEMQNDKDVTTSEAVTFFSSLLDSNMAQSGEHSEVFDFAKKQAANLYNKYSRNVITDVQEFVDDVKQFISG